MLKSVLLHLSGCYGSDQVIELGARIAQRCNARLQGLSVLDNRSLQNTGHLVSAVHTLSETTRLAHTERRQSISHDQIRQVGQRYQLEFDSLGLEGDPIRTLARESQFHDLLVGYCPIGSQFSPGELDPWQHVELASRSRQPLYVSRGEKTDPRRVLLVYDGSVAAARAIRTFLSQSPLEMPQCRLLGVEAAANECANRLLSMRRYCESRCPDVEVGYLTGSVRRVLIPYAQKWEADVVVMGIPSQLGLWSRWVGQLSLVVLRQTKLDLYLMG